MEQTNEFYVFDGREWLQDDEHTWTSSFVDAASFTSAEHAEQIAEREAGDRIFYVLRLFH